MAHEVVAKKIARNQFHKSRIANTLESLEGASLLLRDFIGSDFGYARPSSIDASYEIEGINVRISPTSIVFVRNPLGGMEVGILKLHCSKSFRLGAIAAADYGALLHWYTDAKLGLMGPPNPDLCIILDVFSGEKFKAPKSFKMRRRTISEACQEIADRWDKIASREDSALWPRAIPAIFVFASSIPVIAGFIPAIHGSKGVLYDLKRVPLMNSGGESRKAGSKLMRCNDRKP